MYLNGVKHGSFPEHGLKASHTANDILNLNHSGLESRRVTAYMCYLDITNYRLAVFGFLEAMNTQIIGLNK